MFSVGASCPVSSHRRMSLSSAWLGSTGSSNLRQFRFPDTASLQGRAAIRKNYAWKEKAEYFGSDLKTDVIVERDVVAPGAIIKGHLIIDTKHPIEHDGIFIELEALCSLNYSTKHNERMTVHKGKGCILENTKVNPFGHLESPIKCEIVPITPPEFGGHSLNSGVWHYPFQLVIPCDPLLPAPFQNSHGTLDYKLLVHMVSHSAATYVKLSEVKMHCEGGYYNLYEIEEATKPIVVEQFYRKSYFSQKKLVKATLTVAGGGFLHLEEIPFSLLVKNPKSLPLHVTLNFLQHVKYQANTNLASVDKIVTVVESREKEEWVEEPKQEIRWKGTFHIPESLPPSYTCNSMYSVSYCLEFQIKSLEELIISGQANILLGTIREPVKPSEGFPSTSDLQSGELHRSGSESSLHSQRSIYSTPIAYSVPANLNLSIDEPDDDEDFVEDGAVAVSIPEEPQPSTSTATLPYEATTSSRLPSTSSHSPNSPPFASHSPNAPRLRYSHQGNDIQEVQESSRTEPSTQFPSTSAAHSPTFSYPPDHGGGGGGSLNLPPSYSQLSSRIPSTETLPPTYADLDLADDQIDGTDDGIDADIDEEGRCSPSCSPPQTLSLPPHSSPSLIIVGDEANPSIVDLEKRLSINLNTLNLVEDEYQVTFYSV